MDFVFSELVWCGDKMIITVGVAYDPTVMLSSLAPVRRLIPVRCLIQRMKELINTGVAFDPVVMY